MFGKSVTLTDGRWTLHQSPKEGNRPLHWYGTCLAKFIPYQLGSYRDGKRDVIDCESWQTPTWLSDKGADPGERRNMADEEPEKLAEMRQALVETLLSLKAPAEQFVRLGLLD